MFGNSLDRAVQDVNTGAGYNRAPLCVSQVVAIVMDLLTDLQILQDLLDASSRRGVAVYAVLEAKGVPHFLDMCARLQINAVHLRVSAEPRQTVESGGRRLADTAHKG